MMIGKTMGTPIAYLLTDPDRWGIQSQEMAVFFMVFWFAIPALLIGWVLQAVIVAIRGRTKHGA